MPYLDESGLSTYDSELKEWVSSQESKTITSSIYSWTKTAKAGAVSCYPVGGTELKPMVDFLFTETPPAEGDKSPTNPSTITGVSSVKVTRCGKNLAIMSPGVEAVVNVGNSYTLNGVTFTPHSDGSYTANGTAEGASADFYPCLPSHSGGVKLVPGQTYTLSGCPSGGSSSTYSVRMYPNDLISCHGEGVSFISSVSNSNLYIRINKDVHVENLVFHPQVELGNTATAFESPVLPSLAHHDIPLDSTYYGGTLDVASGVMTVTHEVLSFDGTEELWVFGGEVNSSGIFRYCYYPLLRNAPSSIAVEASSHFDYLYNWNSESEHFYVAGNGCNCFSTKTTLEAFKSWLASQKAAGTPVTITYPLATPYTVQLDPVSISALSQADKYTPRLNTIYTDASSVQVGYVKSPIREEYELQQAIVAQGGNV